MKRKILSLALALAFLILLLSGCSKIKGAGKAFSYPISSIPSSLDPQIVSSVDAKIIVNNCFEGLVRLNSSGDTVFAAAESCNISNDGLEYVFKIREDARWHLISSFKKILGDDYKESFNTDLTANDFVFALRRALNPATASDSASLLYSIKNAYEVNKGKLNPSYLGVSAIDNKTLKIELSSPNDNFLSVLAQPVCMPCNQTFFDSTGGRYGRDVEFTLCNGPFYLSKINDGSSVVISKNPDYSGASDVFPASVSFKIPGDDFNAVDQIISESLSAAVVSSEDGKLLSDQKGITVLNCENIVWAFCFNNLVPDLQNNNLRLAIYSCINKDLFSSVAFNCGQADRLLPPVLSSDDGHSLSFPSSSSPGVLWQSALKSLDKKSIELTVLCAEEHEFAVRAQLQEWQKAFGLSCAIKVKTVTRSELETALQSKNYEIAFAPISVRQSSPLDFLNVFSQNSSQNILNYSSKAYSDLLSKAHNAKTNSDRNSYCLQAEQMLLNSYSIYPVFYENSCFAIAKGISGINTSANFETIDFISAIKK